jgi:hypothetical protein
LIFFTHALQRSLQAKFPQIAKGDPHIHGLQHFAIFFAHHALPIPTQPNPPGERRAKKNGG